MINIFLISWIIGLVIAIIYSVYAWVTKDKEMWDDKSVIWVSMILFGWFAGIGFICVMIYAAIESRFDKRIRK